IERSWHDHIGGAISAGQANLISGNETDGIEVLGSLMQRSIGNTIQGNFIGTTADGRGSLGNGKDGVFLGMYTSDTTIGLPNLKGNQPPKPIPDKPALYAANTIACNSGNGVGVSQGGWFPFKLGKPMVVSEVYMPRNTP